MSIRYRPECTENKSSLQKRKSILQPYPKPAIHELF